MNSAAYRKGNQASTGGAGGASYGHLAASFKSSDAEQTPVLNTKNGSTTNNNSTPVKAATALSGGSFKGKWQAFNFARILTFFECHVKFKKKKVG